MTTNNSMITNRLIKKRAKRTAKCNIFLACLFAAVVLVTQSFKQRQMTINENLLLKATQVVADSGHTEAVQHVRKSNHGKERKEQEYVPASTEDYIMNNFEKLGYHVANWKKAKGCPIWLDPEVSTQENYDNLQAFVKEIDAYSKALEDFNETVPNLVETVRRGGGSLDQKELCKATRPHPDGIQALFPSKQLSLTPAGYVEPLLTPMRHPTLCTKGFNVYNALRLDYLVHDFEQMCLNLKPHSKSIFIDMGASLKFHGQSGAKPPVLELMKSFEKFGFHFDHIYAAEITAFDPQKVFEDLLPEKYFASYHWINAGVSADKESKLNLLRSIVSKFDEDDLIVVKLDIDYSDIEVPLAHQLLEDDSISKLVDQFYFEHHVEMNEIARCWRGFMKGSVQDSFELMNGLRKKGVAAHFWV
eukprot:CAMPEP_0203633410 /NCGR_PEP_ID=MMETSP0088-20131115/518_1 /ASSEMBLY_ACC=CAM_ASM_001087 /TAXON_ID=426623 /ORGANISM="Chaetoceros affinis, Strain CCMP159" /LENGTH=416 /DNA_ID=CAMNT_0050486713 /DNA_START=76 /DNA_END=1326 /DNA_ORIENTATION=+